MIDFAIKPNPALRELIYPNDLELQVANTAAASSRKGIKRDWVVFTGTMS
ncbi:hypothetical protein P781_06235 [Vibrio mimicus CAIM 1883]|nr:hypothetical protein P780_06225 [Vibrio mimicus CAIM 1882]ERM58680.1 hypothetical protein P781_06235 [Vibrio mimicus CAIM 1883]